MSKPRTNRQEQAMVEEMGRISAQLDLVIKTIVGTPAPAEMGLMVRLAQMAWNATLAAPERFNVLRDLAAQRVAGGDPSAYADTLNLFQRFAAAKQGMFPEDRTFIVRAEPFEHEGRLGVLAQGMPVDLLNAGEATDQPPAPTG